MSRGARSLVRLTVVLFTAVLTGIGSVAYASQPAPDTGSDGNPPLAPSVPTPSGGGTSFAQEVAWMAAGAALVLLIGAVTYGIAVLSRRHRVDTRQLQMP